MLDRAATTNVRPLFDRILVKRVEEPTRSRGGIFLPEATKEKPVEGIVLAVGNGKVDGGKIFPLSVKEGDRVVFGKYAGTEIKVNGEDRLILREDDVLGVVE